MKKWKRKCPKCGKEIPYSTKRAKVRAEKRNTNCRLCASWNKGIPRTEEEKKKISESNKGKKRSEETKLKISDNNAYYWKGKKHSEESKKKSSESNKGQKRSEETRKNMRISALKSRGITFPNHNPKGCKIINDYNKKHGFNFQHAENGGEVCIDGYFPDGVDEKRKTIIEIDEPRHFNSDGTYKEKDIQRQKYLEDLGYKFIRVRI